MRLAISEITPDEYHRRARRRREQDEAGDIAIDLVRRKVRSEQPADEEPTQERHGERFYRPVDEERNADTAPMLLDARQSREIDFHEHGNDHQPDQDCHRQIDLGDLGQAD